MEQKNTKRFTTYDLVFIGVMSAVVFVANFFSIPIGTISRIHFGNVFCVLSGLLLGGVPGGLCAGIGSFFYDLTNPLYASGALITFSMKFVLGFLAGSISHRKGLGGRSFAWNVTGAVAGSLTYVLLYLLKNFIEEYFLIKNPIDTVFALMITKGGASLINGIIAVVVAVALAPLFQKALEKSGLGRNCTR